MKEKTNPIKVSDSEWEVMRVIWTLGQADAKDVTMVLEKSKNWKAATVKTLLGRLVKKEVLQTESVGKKFIYHPIVSEEQTVQSAAESLFSHICAKKMGSTIADILAQADLTAEDIQKIEAVIAKKKPVASISCNCIPGQCQCSEHKELNHKEERV